ncbi:hypothetical protein T492DRAFT_1129776 [Pavlovales sp. CCMP2436]|nr:hypothetical protein T492DRAFT_1129776 [Pavlovales sp. CCMP2436]
MASTLPLDFDLAVDPPVDPEPALPHKPPLPLAVDPVPAFHRQPTPTRTTFSGVSRPPSLLLWTRAPSTPPAVDAAANPPCLPLQSSVSLIVATADSGHQPSHAQAGGPTVQLHVRKTRWELASLALGATGVVFGDIGRRPPPTSPPQILAIALLIPSPIPKK